MSDLNPEEILSVGRLARLHLDSDKAAAFAADIGKILDTMAILNSVDTQGVDPLTNVHEACQPLRADVADPNVDRDAYQAVAPEAENGLYLVPQVIE